MANICGSILSLFVSLQGIFPDDSDVVRGGVHWSVPFFHVLVEPAVHIATSLAKWVSAYVGHNNCPIHAVQDKIFAGCYLGVLELLNTYGPILPIPFFVRKEMPIFFRLMTEETEIGYGRMQTNIPMFVAIVMFFNQLGNLFCCAPIQPPGFEKACPDLEQRTETWKH